MTLPTLDCGVYNLEKSKSRIYIGASYWEFNKEDIEYLKKNKVIITINELQSDLLNILGFPSIV